MLIETRPMPPRWCPFSPKCSQVTSLRGAGGYRLKHKPTLLIPKAQPVVIPPQPARFHSQTHKSEFQRHNGNGHILPFCHVAHVATVANHGGLSMCADFPWHATVEFLGKMWPHGTALEDTPRLEWIHKLVFHPQYLCQSLIPGWPQLFNLLLKIWAGTSALSPLTPQPSKKQHSRFALHSPEESVKKP